MPDFLRKILSITLLLAAQVLVLNHIHVAGYAAPFLFPLAIINWQRGSSRVSMMVVAFVIGLIADMFTNTPGIAAASLTLLAFVQPKLLDLFVQNDSDENLDPSFRTLGISGYMKFVVLAMVIHNAVYFLLEFFTLYDLPALSINYAISTSLSLIIMLVLQSFRK